MNKITVCRLFVIVLSGFLFETCQSKHSKQEYVKSIAQKTIKFEVHDIPFTIAQRYFVNNTIKGIKNPKITTKEEFDSLFGMAPVVGENGLPTPIDFSKQFVIAIVKQETNQNIILIPISLQTNEKNEMVFSYKIEKGEELTYTIRPCLLLIVDKEFIEDVVLKKQ